MTEARAYTLRTAEGKCCSVTEEIYKTFYRMKRNERYQEEGCHRLTSRS